MRSDKQTIKDVARKLKREDIWEWDYDTRTIRCVRGEGKSTVLDLYRYIQDEMSKPENLIDPTPIRVTQYTTPQHFRMVNGYSLTDDTLEQLEDPENLVQ